MKTQEPGRLADGEGSESLRKLLGAAENDVLREESRGRVWAALAAAGVTAAATGATVASGAKVGSSIIAWLGSAKGVAAVVCLLGVAGVGVSSWYASHPSATPLPASASLAPSSRWAGLASPSAVDQPSAEAPLDQEPLAAPAPSTSARRVVATSRPSASSPVAAPPAEPSPREGLLLLRARQSLDSNPAQALELARQHEREFPDSQLAPERAKLMREAQARLGH